MSIDTNNMIVTLKSEDDQEFKISKLLLNARSEYFKGMFNSKMIESQQNHFKVIHSNTL